MTAYSYTLVDSVSPWDAGKIYTVRAYYDLNGVALAQNDTITATNIIPANGVEILEVLQTYPELDSNATPTGTLDVGDANDVDRFIDGVPMGVNGITTAGFQLRQGINIAPASTSGVVTSGPGYIYSAATSLITTVSAAVATGATAGVIHLLVTYRCVGNS